MGPLSNSAFAILNLYSVFSGNFLVFILCYHSYLRGVHIYLSTRSETSKNLIVISRVTLLRMLEGDFAF